MADFLERAMFVADLLDGPTLPPDMVANILSLRAKYYRMEDLSNSIREAMDNGFPLGKIVEMFIFFPV